jgi:hypothetical protein
MGLIATGDNLRNKAMLGLEAMSQEEAEREAVRQQMLRAEKAQRAQLAGTGLGIGGGYVVNNYGGQIADYARGLFGGGAQATPLNISPITAAQMQSEVAGATKAGADIGGYLGTSASSGGSALSNTSVANALNAEAGRSAFLQTGQGLNAASLGSGVSNTAANIAAETAATKAATAGAGVVQAGTAATGAGAGVGATSAAVAETTAATAANAAAPAAAPAGGLLPLAGPLAIGVGAFFLLDALFDF